MKAFLFIFTILGSISAFSQINNDSTLSENIVFTKPEVDPSFPGGLAGWKSFLEKNLNANTPVENGAPVGIYQVMAQFIVDKSGALSDIRMLTNFGFGMEKEVLRILKMSPQWIPAMQNKTPVKAYQKQPVTFVVDIEGFHVITKDKYIFYTETDNTVTFKVDKVKDQDLSLTLSQGNYKLNGNGNYTINVDTPGKLIIYVYNKKKKNDLLGSVYFNVWLKSK